MEGNNMCNHCDNIDDLKKEVDDLNTRLDVEIQLRAVEIELRKSQTELLHVRDEQITSLKDKIADRLADSNRRDM